MKGLATRKAGEIRPGERARLQCPYVVASPGGGAEAPSLARTGSMIAAAALSNPGETGFPALGAVPILARCSHQAQIIRPGPSRNGEAAHMRRGVWIFRSLGCLQALRRCGIQLYRAIARSLVSISGL